MIYTSYTITNKCNFVLLVAYINLTYVDNEKYRIRCKRVFMCTYNNNIM